MTDEVSGGLARRLPAYLGYYLEILIEVTHRERGAHNHGVTALVD